MKRRVALVLIFSLLASALIGCSNKQAASNDSSETTLPMYDQEEFNDYRWSNNDGYYEIDVIPNEEVAQAVAEQIFAGLKEQYDLDDRCIVQSVYYYEKQNAWIVALYKPINVNGLALLGGGCTIALQKKDGKVLRIWIGG